VGAILPGGGTLGKWGSYGVCVLLFSTRSAVADAAAQVKGRVQYLQYYSVPSLKRIHNVVGDEFITGILFNKYFQESSDTTVGAFWEFARRLNASDRIGTSGFTKRAAGS